MGRIKIFNCYGLLSMGFETSLQIQISPLPLEASDSAFVKREKYPPLQVIMSLSEAHDAEHLAYNLTHERQSAK